MRLCGNWPFHFTRPRERRRENSWWVLDPGVSREPGIGWSKIDRRSFGELDVVCALFPHALTVCRFRA
jgi:hypothetical protein